MEGLSMQHYTPDELRAASLIGEWLLPAIITLALILLVCIGCV
jgi:hypothetical protein